jgi:serine phosphatase RsbU (regulator of sigma subunit)
MTLGAPSYVGGPRPPPAALDPHVERAPCAVVVADHAGTLLAVNREARNLFPAAHPGLDMTSAVGWLAEAHGRLPDDGGEPATQGRVGDRRMAARPVRHDDATVAWWLVDETASLLAQDTLLAHKARTTFLDEVSTALLGSLNLQRCADIAAELAVTHLCDAVWVLPPDGGGRFAPVFRARDGAVADGEHDVDAASVPGLAEALDGFPPVPSRWLDPANVPAWVVPGGFGRAGSVAVVPLPGYGVAVGAMILLRAEGAARFTDDEEAVTRLFAGRVGVAMSAARVFAQQDAITETLMRDLLPPVLRHVAGVELAGRYRPARDGDRVGGDFFDVHPVTEAAHDPVLGATADTLDEAIDDAVDVTPDTAEGALVVLGDVCGKGLDAAVFTGKIRSVIHALLPLAGDHLSMLRMLNRALLTARDARFVTLALASVERRGATVHLRLTSGGHPAPLIVRTNGRVEETRTRGTLVGAMPDIDAVTVEATLAPGETCLLYTDGITEAHGGPFGDELFDDHRLQQALAGCAGMPAEAVVERIQMLASQWIGTAAHDDMAVVAITAPRGRHLSAVGGHGPGRYTA